jgi:DNA-binding NtrC family response regulator
MEIKLDLPAEVFDDGFTAEDFASRVREFAVIELLRARRLHEHEAQRILGIERWDLVERMERAGIAPTEKVFDGLKAELSGAIAARRGKSVS